jgi:hypothetical protein
MLQSAIAEVGRDTGLTFVEDGPTMELPRSDRPAYEPGVYGDRWAPVLIAWTTPEAVHRLAGHATGLGGPRTVAVTGDPQSVSGVVYLDSAQLLAELYAQKQGRALIRTTMLHELGHLVGLAHSHDKSSIMYPEGRLGGPVDFSAGDLRGLSYLGRGQCFPYAARS